MKLYLCECQCKRQTTPYPAVAVCDYCLFNGGVDCKVNPISPTDTCLGCGTNENLTRGFFGWLACYTCRANGQETFSMEMNHD